jgi:hypothetical protein
MCTTRSRIPEIFGKLVESERSPMHVTMTMFIRSMAAERLFR